MTKYALGDLKNLTVQPAPPNVDDTNRWLEAKAEYKSCLAYWKNLGAPARYAGFFAAQKFTLESVAACTDQELRKLRGIGTAALAILHQILSAHGLRQPEPAPNPFLLTWSLQEEDGNEVGLFEKLTKAQAIEEAAAFANQYQKIVFLVPLEKRLRVEPTET